MTLTYILLATFCGGALSALVAGLLAQRFLQSLVRVMVSWAAGALLSATLLHLLPEAFESDKGAHALFAVLLGGFLFFFLLEKVELYRHSHHHEHDDHDHHHGFDKDQAGRGGWAILIGDGLHNFCDGVLIAGAFIADVRLGVVTAAAVIAHEIPQEVGDYMVLINAGFSKQRAMVFNLISGLMAMAGGLVGYLLLDYAKGALPYVLVFSSASFLYVAVSDLMPQMQRRLGARDTMIQLSMISLGVLQTLLMMKLLHAH
jgi:zinc and cadmium transporter